MTQFRLAFRRLRGAPSFALTAILTLGACFGVNTALLSILVSVVWRPQPGLQQPDRLVQVTLRERRGTFAYPSPEEFQELRSSPAGDGDLAFYAPSFVTMAASGATSRLMGASVSPEYFRVLLARPRLGRFFIPSDFDVSSSERPVVISHRLWKSAFDGATSILGRTLQVDGRPAYVVVGVAADGFHGPEGFIQPDLWLPLRKQDESPGPGRIVGRMSRGTDPQRLGALLQVSWTRVQRAENEQRQATGRRLIDLILDVAPLRAGLQPEHYWAVRVLVGGALTIAAIVLLVACINLGGLALARAMARQKDVAIMRALGADAYHVVADALLEVGIVVGVGACVGLLPASAIGHLLIAVAGSPVPFTIPFELDFVTVALAAGLTVVSIAVSAVVPVVRTMRADPATLLRGDTVSSRGNARSNRIQDLIVALQVACAAVLITVSVTITNAARTRLDRESGIARPDQTLVLRMPTTTRGDSVAAIARVDRVVEHMRSLPGVAEVSAAYSAPSGGSLLSIQLAPWTSSDARASRSVEGDVPPTRLNVIDTAFFGAVGVRALAGRLFTADDERSRNRVVVLSRTLASRLFGGQDPVGRLVTFNDDSHTAARVSGIVPDVAYTFDTDDDSKGEAYVLATQFGPSLGRHTLLVRAAMDPAAVKQELDATMRSSFPTSVVEGAASVRQFTLEQTATSRTLFKLLASAGFLALALACTGAFGVASYNARQRVREVGVRLALGSSQYRIIWLFARRALIAGSCGLAVGLGVLTYIAPVLPTSLGLSQGVPARSAAASTGLMLGAIAIAVIVAVWRMATMKPVDALRAT